MKAEIKHIDMSEYVNMLPQIHLDRTTRGYIITQKKDYVFVNTDGFNKDYCESNNFEVVKTRIIGGTIVSFKQNVCFTYFNPDDNNMHSAIFTFITNKLQNRGIQAECIENDIVIDKTYKVAGFGKFPLNLNIDEMNRNRVYYTAMFFSIHLNLEVINNICTKPMVKIPKGLEDYGITTQDLVNWLNQFFDL